MLTHDAESASQSKHASSPGAPLEVWPANTSCSSFRTKPGGLTNVSKVEIMMGNGYQAGGRGFTSVGKILGTT